jgi:hypothetical protein
MAASWEPRASEVLPSRWDQLIGHVKCVFYMSGAQQLGPRTFSHGVRHLPLSVAFEPEGSSYTVQLTEHDVRTAGVWRLAEDVHRGYGAARERQTRPSTPGEPRDG